MLPSSSATPIRRSHTRHLLAALLFAVGCSGSGASCGGCGGALSSTFPDGGPFRYTGEHLDNSASVRITQDGFNLLNAATLNSVVSGLGDGGAPFNVPCFATADYCACSSCPPGSNSIGLFGINATQLQGVVGDENFSGACDSSDQTPVNVTFDTVSFALDPTNQLLKAKIIINIKSGDLYLRTAEAHSSLCSNEGTNSNPNNQRGEVPIQGHIYLDDSQTLAHHTELDVDLQFSTAPDGRIEIKPTQASLDSLLQHIDITMLFIDGLAGTNPAPPATGTFQHNGCDSPDNGGIYNTMESSTQLACGGFLNAAGLGFDCDPSAGSITNQTICQILLYVKTYLETYLKTTFQSQIVGLLNQQLDNVRCQRKVLFDGGSAACANDHDCPKDDNGTATTCNASRGVCVAAGQDGGAAGSDCEPTAIGIAGQLDLSALTTKVGFPANTKLNLSVGLGSKHSNATIDQHGIQLAANLGTQPASPIVPAVCVPPTTFPPIDTSNIPPLNFDDPNNQPDGGVGTYDVGISLASGALNQASYDAFNAGVFCIEISNQTSSFVSTQLFKTFLPSLGLLTGGRDAPMAILLRPTGQPSVRVGLGTITANADGTFSPNDPLLTLNLKGLNLDFYAVIDERWVRLFTLQTDVALPLGLRTFAGSQADTLQPVLGSLTTLLSNITASDNVMLAEDPAVITDLLGAVIQFAGPLLAGVLRPIALPQFFGFDLQVKGVGGAVPISSNIAQDGYQHLAIWAGITNCGGTGQPACRQHNTSTSARLVESILPSSPDEIRGPMHKIPTAIIEASATGMDSGPAEYSYRIDGGLWTPWQRESRITIQNTMFIVQGHHTIEVTSREAGDDRSQDLHPVSVDFLSSYEAPSVALVELSGGRVATRAKSQANSPDQLQYAYRIGDGSWSAAGSSREFTAAQLNGQPLSVRVIDERGFSAEATYGAIAASAAELNEHASMVGGCATGARAPAWSLLPIAGLFLVMALRRRRSGTLAR